MPDLAMAKPIMIGAHTPKRAAVRRAKRDTLCESAAMINRAYDEVFLKSRSRTHLAYMPMLCSPRSDSRWI